MNTIPEFQGKHRFLSNFWPAPVLYEGELYPTVEHAYQATKTLDPTSRRLIQNCSTPALAKKLSRSIPIRPHWDEIKVDVMRDLVRRKFEHKHLAAQLLATGNAQLEEGNWWNDKFWGICRGQGHNHLGKILMEVREELRGG